MKEEMESLEISAAIKEMKSLKGGYLQKIYQPKKGELLFKIHIPGVGKKMLVFKLGKGLYLTERNRDNPIHPGDYVMLMRKYLSNASIIDIYQHEFDRVVIIELQKEKKYRLIFEIFGKGNLILDGEKKILLPYRSESWSHRDIKEGAEYRFPPHRLNPFNISEEEIIQIMENSEKDLVRTLAVDLNLGGKYAEEICSRLKVDKNMKDYMKQADNIIKIIYEIRELIFENNLEPKLVKENEKIIDAVPIPFYKYEEYNQVDVESYNKALDKAMTDISEKEEIDKKESSRLERKLDHQKNALESLKGDVLENKIIAEIIYQNYKKCQEYLEAVHKARDENRRDEIYDKMRDLDDVVQLNDMDEYIVVKLNGEYEDKKYEKNVRLDFRKDVNENAQKYYNKSKKSRKKIEGAKKAIEVTKEEIKEGGMKEEKEITEKKPTIKFWFDKYKWFISSEDNLVIAGKDTKTNEEVVKKYMEKNSRYAHADAGGAPSVVIRADNEIGDNTLDEACQYSIVHSKEWKRGIASGRAYWVKPSQVSKTAEAGESLPTGAFVIRGKRNYIDKLPLKAVLVEFYYEGQRKIMCAPSLSIERRKESFGDKKVTFIPGNRDQNDFAREMSDYFNVPVRDIQMILPPGDIKILEKKE